MSEEEDYVKIKAMLAEAKKQDHPYSYAIKMSVTGTQLGDSEGAFLFAEVAKILLKQGYHKMEIKIEKLICPTCRHRRNLKEDHPRPFCHGKTMVEDDKLQGMDIGKPTHDDHPESGK